MNTAVGAEVRKVWTTKLGWGMLIGSVAFAAVGVISQIASSGVAGSSASPLTLGATQRSTLHRPPAVTSLR
jgi:hypothetical protein